MWAAGILGFADVELDLFAVFAVMTFVGIGVDYGIHLIHRYRALQDPVRVTAELAPVIIVAGAITLLGYGTLVGSSYPPLRSIGIVSVVSVVTLVLASVLVLPAMLRGQRPVSPQVVAHRAGLERSRHHCASRHRTADPHRARRGCGRWVVGCDGGRRARGGSHGDFAQRAEGQGPGGSHRARARPARSRMSNYVLILDGDMQHLPEEAARLIDAAVATGADLVVGERQFDRAAMPASRYYANRYGSAALSSFTGVPLRTRSAGIVCSAPTCCARLRLRATGYDIETEMLIKVSRLGGRIVSVPVSAVYGTGRSKLRPVRDTTRTCFRAVYYRYIERL